MGNFNPKLPTKHTGTNKYITFFVSRNRSPTGADYRQPETGTLYSVGTVWQVSKSPTTGTEGDLWMLSKIVANVGYWVKISSGVAPSGGILNVQVQANTAPGVNPVAPTAAGLVTFNGAIVANHSVPVETRTRALNTYNLEVQYATSAAATDGTKSGLAHFNSAQFSVDASGFVSLGGGGVAVDSFQVDANTAPGTNPVLATAAGLVTITGGQIANAGLGNVIRINSLAANTMTVQIQQSGADTASNSTKNGVSHYNSAQFNVGTDSFISLKGSTTLAAILSITGDSGGAEVPDVNGNFNIRGTASQTIVTGTANTETVSLFGGAAVSSFFAFLNANVANVTGDSTNYQIIPNSTSFNVGSNYNTGTGLYTAPKTGKYLLCATISVSNIGAAHTTGRFYIVIRNAATTVLQILEFMQNSPGACKSVDNNMSVTGSMVCSMTATDTAEISVQIYNDTKTIGVVGSVAFTSSPICSFSGELLS